MAMRDSARIGPGTDPRKPRTTAYLKAGGRYLHFTDAGQLADWLAAHPGFPHQGILSDFYEALDAGRRRIRPQPDSPTVTVDETLAIVTDFAAKARARSQQEGDAA
jgi:hypothetical protein